MGRPAKNIISSKTPVQGEENKLNGLPDKQLFRVDEVANYFDVEERTIRLWIEHGKLGATRIAGSTIRVSREAMQKCTLKVVPKRELE